MRFPDDHAEASRRGQSRQVRITLHEVKEQILPDLDDALARELGDFDSLATLRQRVARRTSRPRRAAGRTTSSRRELLRQIAEANDVPAPPVDGPPAAARLRRVVPGRGAAV